MVRVTSIQGMKQLPKATGKHAVQGMRQIPRVIGKHVYGNLYDIDESIAGDLKTLTDLVVESAKLGNMHILELITKKFASYMGIDGGVSVIALVEESHIALHTWPESMYATIDIYTCGEKSDPAIAFKHVLEVLKPKRHKMLTADRSN